MIEDWLDRHEIRGYRRQQFYLGYYQQLVGDFSQLSTWPKEGRERLEQDGIFSRIEPVMEVVAKKGDTEKVVFRRKSDGVLFEAVLMQFRDGRNSVCVSSMVGCPVGCVFCATGKMGFGAMLSGDEIVDQVLYFARKLKGKKLRVSNVVFMGMGEPLLNLAQVMPAIETLTDPQRFGIGERRVTLSTSGYVPAIREVLERGFRGRLAVSLHAATQELRQWLMPVVAQAYPLAELMAVLDEWVAKSGKRVSYEYVLIAGVNDSKRDAQQLIGLLRRRLAHVNLIPYNPIGAEEFRRSKPEDIQAFSRELEAGGIHHTVRVTMGDDIAAACGQLANKRQEEDKPIGMGS